MDGNGIAGGSVEVTRLLFMGDYEVSVVSIGGADDGLNLAGDNDRKSGDWAGAVQIDDTRFRVVEADLRGKGDGAGPYHDLLESKLTNNASQSALDWLTEVHDEWPDDRFATVAVLDVDTVRHQAQLVRAGHLPAILKAPNTTARSWLGASLGPVGIDEAFRVNGASFSKLPSWRFVAGGRCVLVSDGVTEARRKDQDMFGTARLLEAVEHSASGPQTAELIASRALRYWDPHGPRDDLTVVVVSRRFGRFPGTIADVIIRWLKGNLILRWLKGKLSLHGRLQNTRAS